MKRQKSIVLLAAAVGILVLVGLYLSRASIHEWYRQWQQEPVPNPVSLNEIYSANAGESTNEGSANNAESTADTDNNEEKETETVVIPESINLDIPFTSQAPHGNWELPYQEACEEASSIMAARFLLGRSIQNADDANTAIVELVNYNLEVLGQTIDTTAKETARLIEKFYGLQTDVVAFDWNRVKRALAQGYPVIIPAAGRELGNPYYRQPGPLYHMMVIKGYTPTKIITNDPGTKRGADYQYEYSTIENAVHDWNNGDVTNGAKVMIVVRPSTL